MEQCSFCKQEATIIVALTQGLALHYLNLCMDCYLRYYAQDRKGTEKLFCLRAPSVCLH
jgi:hypothetical protein